MLASCAYFAVGAASGVLAGLSKKLFAEPVKAGVEAALAFERKLARAVAPGAIGQRLIELCPLPASAHQQRMLLELFEHDLRIGTNGARGPSRRDVARARALLLSRGFGGGGGARNASFHAGEGAGNDADNAAHHATGIDWAIRVDARSAAPDEPLFFARFVGEEIKKQLKKLEEEKKQKAPAPLLALPEPEQARDQEGAARAAEAAEALAAEEERNKKENEKEEEEKVAAPSAARRGGRFVFTGDWSDLDDSDDDPDSDEEDEKEEDPMDVDELSLSASPSSATSAPVAIVAPTKHKDEQARRVARTSDSASSLAAAGNEARLAPRRPPLPPRDAAWAREMCLHLSYADPAAAPAAPRCTQLAYNFYCREDARRDRELACADAYSNLQRAVWEMDERVELSRRRRQLERASELRALQEEQAEQRRRREAARRWSEDFVAAGRETLLGQLDSLEAQKLEQRLEARRKWDDPAVDVLLDGDDDDDRLAPALATPPRSPPRPRPLGAEAVLSSRQFHALPSVEIVIAENTAPAEEHKW